MELTDAVLLERWTRGRSADAFAELVARHGGMVYGTCRRIVRDPATAEDVAQECFIKLSTHEKAGTPCLAGWLHRVAMRRSLDHLRAARRRGAREAAYSTKPSVSTDPAWNEIAQWVDESVAALPEDLRVPVLLHYFEGQTHAAISETLGITRSGVTRQIRRGTEQVQTLLKQRGVSTTAAGAIAVLLVSHGVEAAPRRLLSWLGKNVLAGKTLGSGVGVAAVGVGKTYAKGGLVTMKWLIMGVVMVGVLTVGALYYPNEAAEEATPIAVANAESVVEVAAVAEVEPTEPEIEAVSAVTEEVLPEPTMLRCVDQEGAPVGGAEVYFTHRVSNQKSWGKSYKKDEVIYNKVGPVMADDAGFVALPNFDEPEDSSSVFLAAYARVPGEKVGGWMRSSVEPDLSIVMVDAITVEGVVEVPKGFTPMVVEVNLLLLAFTDGKGRMRSSFPISDNAEEPWPAFLSGHPDVLGRFTIQDMPAAGSIYLAANGPGLAERQAYTFDPANWGDLKLDMVGEGVIQGKVHFADTGRPAWNYHVSARADVGGVTYPHVTQVQQNGTYRIGGLAAGEYSVVVAPKKNPREYVATVQEKLQVEPGFVTEDIDFWLERGALVTGKVTVKGSGDPIADVMIVALSPGESGGEAIGSPTTDEAGQFELRLPTGESMLYMASVPQDFVYPKDQASRVVEIGEGETRLTDVNFELARNEAPPIGEATIRGRVVDENGEPLADAVVMEARKYLQGEDERQWGNTSLGKTDQDGRFEVTVQSTGTHRISVGKVGYTQASGEWFSVDAGEEKVIADLAVGPATNWIAGIVVDAEGYPIADVLVMIGAENYFKLDTDPMTDREGRFRIEHLPDEEVSVFLLRFGFEQFHSQVAPGAEYEFALTVDAEEAEEGVVE